MILGLRSAQYIDVATFHREFLSQSERGLHHAHHANHIDMVAKEGGGWRSDDNENDLSLPLLLIIIIIRGSIVTNESR